MKVGSYLLSSWTFNEIGPLSIRLVFKNNRSSPTTMTCHLSSMLSIVENLLIVSSLWTAAPWRHYSSVSLISRTHSRLNSLRAMRLLLYNSARAGYIVVWASCGMKHHLHDGLCLLLMMIMLFLLKTLLGRLNLHGWRFSWSRRKHYYTRLGLGCGAGCIHGGDTLIEMLGWRWNCWIVNSTMLVNLLGLDHRWRRCRLLLRAAHYHLF